MHSPSTSATTLWVTWVRPAPLWLEQALRKKKTTSNGQCIEASWWLGLAQTCHKLNSLFAPPPSSLSPPNSPTEMPVFSSPGIWLLLGPFMWSFPGLWWRWPPRGICPCPDGSTPVSFLWNGTHLQHCYSAYKDLTLNQIHKINTTFYFLNSFQLPLYNF